MTAGADPERDEHVLREALPMCETLARVMGITAPIRVDCREDDERTVKVIDAPVRRLVD
ncbi:hypothetical protein A8924_5845 [Saccharopolyspora erythraea NRRL 2338]|uniref:Uncharacterized protein n=1 Tax=Saccharopolyspora erythraea TaxID=1836 RepID=A0ABP3NQU3_SACER|nr:hypothetical protein N599_13625 [Saccharopolyspora erythraea D]PFG98336.1 hypothetical protein A8924_5845 [Saccharopolyspora erythraea NRRL 2338]